jgi:hypothetical protein
MGKEIDQSQTGKTMSTKHRLLSLSALLLAVTARAHDDGLSIGINFTDEGNPSQPTALAATNKAGAVPQVNWNNASSASGSATNLVNDFTGNAVASGVSVTWSSPNTWSNTGRGEENNGFPAGPDRAMMTGYLDTDNSSGQAVVTVSGLGPNFTGAGYDVIVYCLGAVAGRGGAYTIGSTTNFGTTPASPSAHVEDPGVDLTDTGTYVRFRDLHDASFTLTASANAAAYPPGSVNFRAPINGIQIIAKSIFNCPTNIVAECSGGLTPVTYNVSTFDTNGVVSVVCTPPSGTGFQLGTSNVTCTASSATVTNTCSFTVTVVDTTPPSLTCPSNQTVNATDPSGAVTNYTATASDACSAAVVTYDIAGTPITWPYNFPIGNTTINVTATDAATNVASCSFTVHVKGAAEQINDLIARINALPGVKSPNKTALTSPLQAALVALAARDKPSACKATQAFINLVKAQAEKKLISAADAAALTADAMRIRAVLGCP